MTFYNFYNLLSFIIIENIYQLYDKMSNTEMLTGQFI